MNITRDDVYSGELKSEDGKLVATYTTRVSPCSWMYPGHGLQLEVKLANGSATFVRTKSIMFENASKQDALNLIEPLRICPCSKCGQPAMDPTTCTPHRDGFCEPCFMKALRAELEEARRKEESELKALDEQYKAQGFTHRVDAWIHAKSGDDQQASFWVVNPTKARIQKELRKMGCTLQTDYQIKEL